MYLIRLDDASEKMNSENWDRMEKLLDKYNIKPLVGIIPNNKDTEFSKYKLDKKFFEKVLCWQNKNWGIALHGYEHVYCTKSGGINPVQQRSEFAGLPLEEQKKKIKSGFIILKDKGLKPVAFFAPSHTFDNNTLIALKEETNIRVISDTIANDIYYENEMFFVPQQSGHARKLPFKITTFCYHPNTMNTSDFEKLEKFIVKYKNKFISFNDINFKKRKLNLYDQFLRYIYFIRR